MTKPTLPAWYDVHHGAYARNLNRILAGQTLTVGDDEQGIQERTVTIDHVRSVIVGIDSDGLFVGVTVLDTEGDEITLYGDGTVTDEDDSKVGTHSFKTLPIPNNAEQVV